MTPPTARPTRTPRRARPALSLVEVMIALTISSMLLTAIAAAFHSSSQIITQNDEFFRATQAARVALNQMLTEVRRADAIPAVADNSGPFTIPPISSTLLPVSRPLGTQYSMEFLRYYRYDAPTKRLLLYFQNASGALGPEYPVATNVQVAPFTWETATDKFDKTYVARVTINMEVAVGNNRIRLSGSAVPRRSIATYDD